MKSYIVTCFVIITVTIGFCFYVWHDTKKFEEGLSPLPEHHTVKTAPPPTAVDGAPPQIVPKTDSAEPNASEHAHPHPLPVPDRHEDIVEVSSEDMAVPVNDADLPQVPTTPNPVVSEKPNRKIPWSEATVDQQIANMRSWLVKNHDNTAEIDEFLGLQRIFMESPTIFVNMSPEDSLRHLELAAKLYPGTGNEVEYQRVLEVRESLKNGTFHLYLQRNNIDLENAEIVPIPINQ